jgi:hypothetical protein
MLLDFMYDEVLVPILLLVVEVFLFHSNVGLHSIVTIKNSC